MDRRYFLKNATMAGAGSLMLGGLPVKLLEANPEL